MNQCELEREKLAKLLINYGITWYPYKLADYLLKNGVVKLPCVAMVEQFVKDGKFDKKHTAHNGRMAVVYIDKSKWSRPLIDITEEFYNVNKAYERIQALKGGAK